VDENKSRKRWHATRLTQALGNPRLRRGIRLLVLGTGALILGLSILYAIRLVSLRARILSEFATLSRNHYSHVVTAPPMLRLGLDIRAVGLVSGLERRGFHRGHSPLEPGQFVVTGHRIVFRNREPFLPGELPAGSEVRLDLDGAILSSIHVDGEAQASVPLPPEHLTSFRLSLFERRTPLPATEIPESLVRAVLAAEDRRFFDHHGLDGRGIGRALWRNLRQRRVVEGGSTITQQVVKLILRRRGRALGSKVDEAILALVLERQFTKRQILQVYLNEVYLGQDGPFAIHGVAEGAWHLFDQPLAHLSQRQQIELAAVIRAPNAVSPKRNPEKFAPYADAVARALEQVEVTWEDLPPSEDSAPPGTLRSSSATSGERLSFMDSQMAYYFDRLTREWQTLSKRYRFDGPVVLVTGLDPLLQRRAAEALAWGLREARSRVSRDDREGLQGALVALDPRTGAVRALVGGDDFVRAPFNRAVDIQRPVGSTFKPFVFLAAMGGRDSNPGITQSSWLPDEPREYRVGRQVWRPANFDAEYRGWVTARTALAQSINTATVALGMEVGVKKIARLAQEMGVADRVQGNPSIFLGALDTSPLRLAQAYACIANGGWATSPHALVEVICGEQRLRLLEDEPPRVLHPQVAYVVTDMLVGALRHGTGRSATRQGFRHLATGKTGTTDETRDAWFVGYTPEIVTSVWVGHDDNRATSLTGAGAALPIWARFMQTSLGSSWDADFEPPPGITFRRIDPETGDLATARCPQEEIAAYIENTEPLRSCSEHRGWWPFGRDGSNDDAREERWRGEQPKPSLWQRIKDAIGT
jgi:penicillin-binding protein 1B